MNDQKQVHLPSEWIIHIRKMLNEKGQCKVSDSQGNPILLKWEKVNPVTAQPSPEAMADTARLNEIIKGIGGLLVPTYVSMELECARRHPEAVESDMFLKRLAPLFENGVEHVDWKVAEQNLTTHLQQFFATTDFTQYSSQDDIQIFVIARDEKTGTQLGVIQFIITPQFEYGTAKVAFFGVDSRAENCGIQKLLLSMIFKLVPDVTRIFLHTRITNEKALNLYQNLDFVKFEGPLPLWADREYLVQKSGVLQEACNGIKTIE